MTRSRGIRNTKHGGICTLPDCGKPYYGKGYCRLHWERNYMNGDPLAVSVIHGPVSERLQFHSQPQGDCVVFTGYRDKDGYGHMSIDERDVPAHRAAYELEHGPLPEGVIVRHKCDNPPCIRPSHLEPGTHADNGNDKAVRDRSTHGELNPSAKLTEQQVLEIRKALEGGAQQRLLARTYGVGQSTISRIKRGTHWTRVREDAA